LESEESNDMTKKCTPLSAEDRCLTKEYFWLEMSYFKYLENNAKFAVKREAKKLSYLICLFAFFS